ncbi:hypothetical protein C8A00DRAFT_33479 [Chaetomidium leptoderma]|uniref:Uncharacterized protein n=1 Tax=Chaetomidium leptoderma TaxID=669021 RepID=A0AAN6VP02_9PEZI|nr:hypothetical protein C8A00DRAFT_33479 [Chaetomidium leptoderma]
MSDVGAFEVTLTAKDRESKWLAIVAEAKNASRCPRADGVHKWAVMESPMRLRPSEGQAWLEAMGISQGPDEPFAGPRSIRATPCADVATQGNDTKGQAAASFGLLQFLPAELRHKILLDTVEPAVFEGFVLKVSNEYGLLVGVKLACTATNLKRDRPFTSIPLYGLNREARDLAIAYFGQPRKNTFPFNPHTDILRLDLTNMRPGPALPSEGTTANPNVITFHRSATKRHPQTSVPVPASVLARIRRVSIIAPQGLGRFTEVNYNVCLQDYLGGNNHFSRGLVRLLAEMLPSLEHLTVEYFRLDDCLVSCDAAADFVGYDADRHQLHDTVVLDLLDALEGGGGGHAEGVVACPFPNLKTFKMVVRGEFCSYTTGGSRFLCCSVAKYVPTLIGERATLMGKPQWWSGTDGEQKVGDHWTFTSMDW